MSAPYPDPPVAFSHLLTQIKLTLLDIVIFLGFLMWLWDKAKHRFRSSMSTTRRPRSRFIYIARTHGSSG